MRRAAITCSWLCAVGCGGPDRTPEGALRLFVKAVEDGNAAAAYRLLAPVSQRALGERARLANAHSGDGQRFKPEDMLAVGQNAARYDLAQAKVVRMDADGKRATMQLVSAKRGLREELELVLVDGAWRVVMPAEKGEPPPADKPPPAPRDKKG
jgi:hypothetical protein